MATEALWFGTPGHEAFGCLHVAAGNTGTTGLVLCSAFGREELTVHRTLRHVAEGAAARGMPALRFDYPCTGDSAGDELEEGQVARWIASIGHAIDLVRQRTGVQRVLVLGFRIGALLALSALQHRDDVAGLVCLAAPASGRTYLRELRMAGQTLVRTGGATPEGNSLLESGGYAMPEDCQRELSALVYRPGLLPAGCPVLAIERDDRPLEAPWLADLAATGHEVRRLVLEGYADMMAPSFRGTVPQALLARLFDGLAWAAASTVPSTPRQPQVTRPPAVTSGPVVLVRLPAGTVRETVACIDPATGLVGVLSEPAEGGAASAVRGQFLLLPPGADRRLGPGRLFVTLARELAAAGHRVLRLDISGVGDSPARTGCSENAVYQAEALEDLALAREFLQKFKHSGRLHVIGHCSGAYNAFKGVHANPTAASVTLINPLVFFWKPGMVLEDPLGQTNLAAAALNYRLNAFSRAHWDRVLREPRKLLHVANVLVRWPLARLRNTLRGLGSACGLPLDEDLGRELRELAQAGVKLHFLFSTGDPGEKLLRLQGGRAVATLQSKGILTVDRIPGADHDLSFRRDRVLLLHYLKAHLVHGQH